ncbi:hypothetical protein [Brevifollis gellanilyticus]|nr:hypothetical protein [Brevifollis gellanilyticus]
MGITVTMPLFVATAITATTGIITTTAVTSISLDCFTISFVNEMAGEDA